MTEEERIAQLVVDAVKDIGAANTAAIMIAAAATIIALALVVAIIRVLPPLIGALVKAQAMMSDMQTANAKLQETNSGLQDDFTASRQKTLEAQDNVNATLVAIRDTQENHRRISEQGIQTITAAVAGIATAKQAEERTQGAISKVLDGIPMVVQPIVDPMLVMLTDLKTELKNDLGELHRRVIKTEDVKPLLERIDASVTTMISVLERTRITGEVPKVEGGDTGETPS